ncbi:low affinity iron permease family protein [Methylobacterium segetis]|uniref:low affinity iron permease family protein n=1 Tax=Methylobacterium segetis TaxID=2488750 RepID=UPI001FDEBF94|nr:low affinity iron permease family protein [Methylobacterium segetis]
MVDRNITRLATWLSKPAGFMATCFVVAAGLGAGIVLSFNDHWALVFNLFLSIAALLMAGIILVAGAKDTSAIQAKLDELIRAVDEADDHLIGIDQRSSEELKKVRVTVDPTHNETKAAGRVS